MTFPRIIQGLKIRKSEKKENIYIYIYVYISYEDLTLLIIQ
jgi:hypothetical protein